MSGDPSAKYAELIRYLNQRGSAKVSDFSRDLFLSESTVRRALGALEAKGKLKRYHGGASLPDPAAHSPIRQRQVSHLKEKNAIGRLAATFVKEGMTLLLMGGTTVNAACPYLKGMRLTVITSSMPVMNELAWEEQMTVILLGGVLNPAEMEVRGGLTHQALERLRADLMLTGTTGLHPIHGLMTDDPNGVETYQTLDAHLIYCCPLFTIITGWSEMVNTKQEVQSLSVNLIKISHVHWRDSRTHVILVMNPEAKTM